MATVTNLNSVTAGMAALYHDTAFRQRLSMQVLTIARYHRDNQGSSVGDKALSSLVLGPGLAGGVLYVFLQLAVSDSTIKNAALSGTAPSVTMSEPNVADTHLDIFVGALWSTVASLVGAA
jgi:hypothetical protein